MNLKVTQGHQKCCYFAGHHLLVVCSNNNSILHHFRDIAIFAVYMTACDLENSIFEKLVAITSRVH